jgi:hypothetical protein
MTAPGQRRAQTAFSSGWKYHTTFASAGSNRSFHVGNDVAKAFDVEGH